MKYNIIVFYIYYLSMSFEAPIRFLLNAIDIPYILYIRDVLLISVIIRHLLKRTAIYDVVMIAVIGIYAVVGFVFTENILQVLWGIKTIYPLYAGLIICEDYWNVFYKMERLYKIVFLSGAIGLSLHWLIGDPWWVNMPDNALTGIENVRVWHFSYDGEVVNRLGGFSRSSIDAAILLLIGGAYLMVIKKNYLFYTLLLLGALVLTTTKANIIAGGIMAIVFGIKKFDKTWFIFTMKVLTGITIGAFVLIPIMVNVLLDIISSGDYGMAYVFLQSFEDRLMNTWPMSVDIIDGYGSYVLGRGIGGIGFSTVLFERIAPYPVVTDSTFLYMYGSIGILSIALLGYMVKRVLGISDIYTDRKAYMLAVLFGFFCIGITTDVLNQMALLHMGIAVGWLIRNNDGEVY
ncbi:hypothetical protein FZ041_04395 [Selenomonas caprae]|uniref:Uncharacterized protein n=1 Tax=Selenomonas caprae TaxID=2606905 RepID=A0A5D6WMM6_9FIRM|nr:hypothetical protein [Selenomonas caprae]TYZ29831.1 hypothetical protein FZ041_04395 [Selenomonas caprae]